MAAAATATATRGVAKLRFSCPDYQRLKPTKKQMGSTKFLINNLSPSTNKGGSFAIRAFEPEKEPDSLSVQHDDDSSSSSIIPQSLCMSSLLSQKKMKSAAGTLDIVIEEDVNYLWKLGAGSVVGAALIKYGSILFPDITRPNLVQALVMICTPVIIAVLLLFNQSRTEQ